MAFVPTQLPQSRQPSAPELRLDRIDGGVSYKYIESQLNNNQSPYMLNMTADDKGALVKRLGRAYVWETSLGASGILSAFDKLYKNKKVFHHSTKLYTQVDSDAPVEIMSGLTASKGVFFVMGDILYYLNGAEFVQWNGTTATAVTGYIPTIAVSTPPAGGGTSLEDFNLIQPYFKQAFSGNGTSVNYQLAVTGLDAAAITASIDGGITFDKVETTHFTVNRTTGVITWLIAPAEGTNNVYIQAAKTVSGNADKIKKCKYAILYGGANDTRVFIAGSDSNTYFYSGLEDATYWPENNFNRLGSDFEKISGFAVQYDTLITFKDRSIYSTLYTLNNGVASFPTKPINSQIGCDMPGTIQLIDNSPVFCNTYAGVHILLSSQIRDERNVRPLSGNINGSYLREGLLDESNLATAISVDNDGKYIICVGGKAWAWDYQLTPYQGAEDTLAWFPWTAINANTWLTVDRELYYGDRSIGHLVKFERSYRDFGNAINAVWRSKKWDFNLPDWLKTVTEIRFATRSDTYTKISIKYFDDNGEHIDTEQPQVSTFSWAIFSWDTFNWQVINFAKTIRRKPKLKKIGYFQIEFSNNEAGHNLSILNLIISYILARKVK